jgi:hypothetical protein
MSENLEYGPKLCTGPFAPNDDRIRLRLLPKPHSALVIEQGFALRVNSHRQWVSCCAPNATRSIQDWLGHRSIQHTVRYTELSPTRFKDFWRD